MRFSIDSELHGWPAKRYETLYGEMLEQIENADRLRCEYCNVDESLILPCSGFPDA